MGNSQPGAETDQTAHWSDRNAFASYDLNAASDPAYEATEQRIEVSVNRDIPQGDGDPPGCARGDHDGSEVIENADVVVTDNRIARVTARPGPPGRGRADHRRGRHHHRSRIRGHPRPYVEPVRNPLATSVDLPGQPGVRGHHDSGSPNGHHRRAHLCRPRRRGRDPRPEGVFDRTRRLLHRRDSKPGPRSRRVDPVQATTSIPRPSRCTCPGTGFSVSG